MTDPAKILFDSAVAFLGTAGVPEPRARSILGKWRKSYPDELISAGLLRAQDQAVVDPIPWIGEFLKCHQETAEKAYRGHNGSGYSNVWPATEPWAMRIENYRRSGFWKTLWWGPPPGESGCRVPANFLDHFHEGSIDGITARVEPTRATGGS